MQKVITINLNGRAYQLEEAAYEALRTYLNLAEVRLEDNALALLAPAATTADRLVIFEALRQLPYQQRAVAVLRYWDDASVAETAALLGISEGTVKSYSARAIARLRELVSDLAEAPPC